MSRQPLLWIAVLGVLFFGDLAVHPGQVLYSPYSDLIPLHLPARRFLARSWQETGTVPLWCPYNLGGMPFIHDVQSSAFYPLHWPLLWLPERHQGAALSWLIVLHVILAGWFMYGYARSRGLESFGAFIAALGYMFAGKWLLHLLAGGHYNMVPLAWLPLMLLCLERALWRRSLLWATAAGVAYALIVLSAYPYITLYVGLFVGLWTLGTVFDPDPIRADRRVPWLRWLGFGVWTVAVAVLLSAVQLWPSVEAAGLASRSLGVPASAETITAGLWSLVGLVGPPLTANPDWLWENRTGLGLLWVALAALGVRLAGKQARWPCVACGFLLAFGCGGAALCQGLPGFRLFQLPSRILLLLAFPVSLLVGMAMDRLAALPLASGNRRFVVKMMALPVLLLALLGVALRLRGEQLTFQPYWVTLLVTLPAAACLLWLPAGKPAWKFAWTGVLLVDLWGVVLPWLAVRPEAELFAPSASVRYLMDRTKEHGRVLDVAPTGTSANNTPLWPGLPVALGIEPVRGFNPVDVLRYKEYLQFLTDHDEPLRPLDRMFTSAVLGGFPIKNQALADLLGIRYLVQPRDLPPANTVLDA
ncbi:MAG TPA: hypothetical protein VFA18_03105, partial [Gemmataceae bacterium]|nr:hypothetical protein [Gemmataceae bacterium]